MDKNAMLFGAMIVISILLYLFKAPIWIISVLFGSGLIFLISKMIKK